MKKIISLILAMAMIIGCISVTAAYPETLLANPTGEGSQHLGNPTNDNSAHRFTFQAVYSSGASAPDTSYVLLDRDDSGNFLIATEKFRSGDTFKFDTNTSDGFVFSVADTSNIGHWLNNENVSSGYGNPYNTKGGIYFLGTEIASHLVEKTWKTEASDLQSIAEASFAAKVVIPSYTEYSNYKDKLNATHALLNSTANLWLRTPANYSGNANWSHQMARIYQGDQFSVTTTDAGVCSLQLFFWVDKTFFTENRVEGIGTEAGKLLSGYFQKSDLSSLYSEAELVAMGFEAEAVSQISNVKLETNIAVPGGTTTVTYDVDQATDSNIVYYYTCDDANGTNPVKIEGLSGASVKIPSSAGSKYFCAGVTNGANVTTYSTPIQIAAALETFSSNINPVTAWGSKTTDQTDYMFSTSWSDFIMLEAAEDGSDFLVMRKQRAMQSSITNAGAKDTDAYKAFTTMDPEADTTFLPNFLNTTYLTIGNDNTDGYTTDVGSNANYLLRSNVTGLPAAVTPYINRDALWRTEASDVTGDEYVFKAAVTVPSLTELKTHASKINLNSVSTMWKTRTPVKNGERDAQYGGVPMFVVQPGGTPAINTGYAWNNSETLVIFRLNREFFINTKIGLTEEGVNLGRAVMGSKVKEMLVANFARSEIAQAGYSEEELEEIGFENNEPVVTNVTAQGIASVAQTLTAKYTYTDPNTSAEDTTKTEYQWYYADAADGEFTAIEGATSKTYVVDSAMQGKYLAVSVRAYNAEGIKSAKVTSTVTSAVTARENIVVIPVSINDTKAEFVIDSVEATNMLLLYCVYNKTTGALVHCEPLTQSVSAGRNTYSVNSNYIVTSDHIAKAMVWENWTTIRPYAMIEK